MPERLPIGNSRQKAEKIEDLRQKFEEFEGPLSNIAVRAGVKVNTLKSAVYRGEMTQALQKKFADVCGFSASSSAWIDRRATANTPRQDRKDTREHFRAYLKALRGRPMLIVAGLPRLGSRFAKVRIDSLEGSQCARKPEDPIKLTDEGDFEPRDPGVGVVVALSFFELDVVLPKRGGVAISDRL